MIYCSIYSKSSLSNRFLLVIGGLFAKSATGIQKYQTTRNREWHQGSQSQKLAGRVVARQWPLVLRVLRSRPDRKDLSSWLLYIDNGKCWFNVYDQKGGDVKHFLSASRPPLFQPKWERIYSHGNGFIHMGTQLIKFYNNQCSSRI